MNRELAASYSLCRVLHARHGRSYYLASLILPPRQRNAVHALYGFARYVDDLVDGPVADITDRGVVDRIRRQLESGLRRGHSQHPILAATIDTVLRFEVDPRWLLDFLNSMAADLEPHRYETWDDLAAYTWGSASVIGLQLTRVLGTTSAFKDAAPAAAALGEAFQLTNFCRDYDEDRRRGRVYLPTEEFSNAGIAPGSGDSAALRAVIAAACDRARELYAAARPGIELLQQPGRECIRTAYHLYGGILDEIEQSGYDVIGRRHRVTFPRRLAIAAPAYARSMGTRTFTSRVLRRGGATSSA